MTHTLHIFERDLVSAQKLHAMPGPWVLVALLTFAALVITVACKWLGMPFGISLGAIIGVPCWIALLYSVILPYQAKRLYRQHVGLRQPHHVHWDDHFLHIRRADTHWRIGWEEITQVKENRDMLLLYCSGTLFNIFPKRCFSSLDSLEDFRARLAASTSPTRGPLSQPDETGV